MKLRYSALILVAALAACSQRTEQELLAAAQKRMEQHDNGGAAIELKNLLQQNPDNATARYLLGKTLLEGGDLAGAEIELRRALDLGVPRDEVVPLLAQTLLNSGQSSKVVGEFGDQSLADPKAMSMLQQSVALAQLGQGNVTDAKIAAGRALALTPDDEGAVIVGARTKLVSGAPDDALEALDRLLAKSPNADKAMLLKAEVLMSRGKVGDAEPLLAKVLVLDPNSYDARSMLMRLAMSRQQMDAAAKLVDEMPPALAKRPQGKFLQAQVALATGDAAKARELSLPLLKLLPNYLPLLRLAAGAHQQLGELPDAENLLNQALKLAPDDPGVRRQYANLQLQRRTPAKAMETLKSILDSGRVDGETLLLAGKAQLMQGNFEAADQAFGAAAKLRPDDPNTAAALALSALARDSATPGGAARAKADTALAQLRELAAKDSGSNYDMMIVSALMRRQDLPGTLAALDKLAPKMKGSPVPDALRGRVQLARRDEPAAQAAFESALKTDPSYLPAVLGLAALDMQAKRNDAAIKRLEAFIASQPHSPQARLALVEVMLQTRAPAERIGEALGMAVREEPSDASLRLALIDHRIRLGDVAGAGQAAQEAMAALPQNPDILERVARTQLAAGDRVQALKSYTQLTKLTPTRASGWLGIAQVRFMEQDLPGAEREIKRALEAEPTSQPAQRLLIQLGLRQGRIDEGLAALHARQKQYPQESYAYIAESEAELGRNHVDAGLAALRKATALREPADAAPRLFAALLAAKKRDEAMAFETQWQTSHPQDQAFPLAAADLLLARGDFDAALTRYEALLKRAPDVVGLINNVAWLRSNVGKPGARELAERGLKINPDDAPLRDTYATVLANEKDYSKALGVIRQLIADTPQQPAYRVTLAKVLIQSGDKAAAKSELQDLTKLGAKFPQQAQVTEMLKTL